MNPRTAGATLPDPFATVTVPANAPGLAAWMYGNEGGVEVWHALLAALNGDLATATAVWWDAAALLDARCTATTVVLPPHARVLPLSGVDHCPVPDQPATVCGIALAATPRPSDLTAPTGIPCAACFGGTP